MNRREAMRAGARTLGASVLIGVAGGVGAAAGGITRLDPELDALIDATAPIELVATGFRWAEGPLWVRRGGYLLFSDVPANVVYRWTAEEGARPFLRPSGLAGPGPAGIREAGANGLALDVDGALLLADSGNRAIARVDLVTRRKTVLADRFEGKRFNSCNDLAVGRGGIVYFTDPPYGLADGDASALKELAFNGVYSLRPGREPRAIDRSLRRPNGVAVSPGGDRLYVSCSDESAPVIRAYDLAPDGSVSGEGRTFVDFAAEHARGLPGLPDGLKVARSGHLFATGPGGVHVVAPDGRKLGRIATGTAIANCAFGEDGRTLFLAASDSIARVRLRTAGW